jgi:RNA polymerase sigma factor (TIGR02999 family)
MNAITEVLRAIDGGDESAAADLLPLVYDELRRLAAIRLAKEHPGHSLQRTALVHEAYLRLVGSGEGQQRWNSVGHFFGAAAEAMRRILVESARRKQRLRHGVNHRRVEVNLQEMEEDAQANELLELNEALDELAAEEPKVAEVVKLRYFAGLTMAEIANARGISVRNANRHWAFAKAWLYHRLREAKSLSDR